MGDPTFDVLAQKNSALEKDLKRYKAEVEHLRTITKNVADFILQTDHNGKIRYFNKLLPGVSKEKALQSSVFDLIPTEESQIADYTLKNVFENGLISSYESSRPEINGERRYYSVRVSPVFGGTDVVSAIFIARDITEQKSAEEVHKDTE